MSDRFVIRHRLIFIKNGDGDDYDPLCAVVPASWEFMGVTGPRVQPANEADAVQWALIDKGEYLRAMRASGRSDDDIAWIKFKV